MQDTFIVTCVSEANVLGSNSFYGSTNYTQSIRKSDNSLLSSSVTYWTLRKSGVKQTRIENFPTHLLDRV